MHKVFGLLVIAALVGLVATAALAADSDQDGVADNADNCLLDSNPDQADADQDGFGDACDADYDNNGIVDQADVDALQAAFLSKEGDANYNAAFDHDGTGSVGLGDFQVVSASLGAAPGPSGLSCAGTTPCP